MLYLEKACHSLPSQVCYLRRHQILPIPKLVFPQRSEYQQQLGGRQIWIPRNLLENHYGPTVIIIQGGEMKNGHTVEDSLPKRFPFDEEDTWH